MWDKKTLRVNKLLTFHTFGPKCGLLAPSRSDLLALLASFTLSGL